MKSKICSFPGCEREIHGKGLCVSHCRQQRDGKELKSIRIKRQNNTPPVISVDIVACHNKELDGPCHIWNRALADNGYGKTSLNGKTVRVHRYVWELTHGKIPKDLCIDHMCRNRGCCNVNHLRLVTVAINSTENSTGFCAVNKAKTHCKYGHPFDEANTIICKSGERRCRVCECERQCRYRAKQKL